MNRIQQAITVAGVGISFVIFMAWGFMLGVLLFPAIRVFRGTRAHTVFHGQVRLAWRVFTHIMRLTRAFQSITVSGLHHLPENRPCLLIGNHLTLVDIVILGAQVPNFNCVVKMGLWNHPFFGAAVKACDFIPNVASEEFIDKCARSFFQNRPLIIFPQGERTPPDAPIKFQRGAAQIAIRTGVDVHPVIITCDPVTLAKGMPWFRVPTSPRMSIRIHPALPPPPTCAEPKPMPIRVRQLNAQWEAYFSKHLKQETP